MRSWLDRASLHSRRLPQRCIYSCCILFADTFSLVIVIFFLSHYWTQPFFSIFCTAVTSYAEDFFFCLSFPLSAYIFSCSFTYHCIELSCWVWGSWYLQLLSNAHTELLSEECWLSNSFSTLNRVGWLYFVVCRSSVLEALSSWNCSDHCSGPCPDRSCNKNSLLLRTVISILSTYTVVLSISCNTHYVVVA